MHHDFQKIQEYKIYLPYSLKLIKELNYTLFINNIGLKDMEVRYSNQGLIPLDIYKKEYIYPGSTY